MTVYNSSPVIAPNWKQLKCLLIGGWLSKQVHPQQEIWLSKNKGQTIDSYNFDGSWGQYTEWKKFNLKGHLLMILFT